MMQKIGLNDDYVGNEIIVNDTINDTIGNIFVNRVIVLVTIR